MQQVTLRRLAGATLQVLGQQGAQLILRVPYPAALQADGLARRGPLHMRPDESNSMHLDAGHGLAQPAQSFTSGNAN